MSGKILADLYDEEAFFLSQYEAAKKACDDWGQKLAMSRLKKSVVEELLVNFTITPRVGDGDANTSDTSVYEAASGG